LPDDGELFLRVGGAGAACFFVVFLPGSSKLTPRVMTKSSMTCSSFFCPSCANAVGQVKTTRAARVKGVLRRICFSPQ
jgi:hypothetical protein